MKFDSDRYYTDACKYGSEELLWAMERQFNLFARKHGVTQADAMLMLQNSFEPVKR